MNYIEEAIRVAKRSSIRTHKTGAVIVYKNEIISNGWSHVPERKSDRRSLHAELHALARARHFTRKFSLQNVTVYVATLGGRSGRTTTAKPCLDCAIALMSAGVRQVRYTTPDGSLTLWLPDEDIRRFKVYDHNAT